MNKKIIYAISTIAMLIVAISIGFIFSQTVPPMVNTTAQNADISTQTNNSNSVTQALEPIEDLITHSAQGKPMPAGKAKTTEKSTTPVILDKLTFSAKDPKKDTTKEKAATEKERAQKETPKKKDVLITKSSLQSKDGLSSIINAELSMDGDQVKLIIEGDNKVETKSFILEEPNRVVFDIKGTWAISIPKIISNRMVEDIRLGKTDTHTRLVFDLKVKPNSTKITQLGPNKAQIIFK